MTRVGESALLLRCHSTAGVLAALRALEAARRPGLRDLVPGAETVLAIFHSEPDARDAAWLANAEAAALGPGLQPGRQQAPRPNRRHEIPVRYDGEDLEAVARHTGLAVADVVGLHASATYRVAFLGFQPGFAYLAGLPAALRIPRRATPRPRVAAGSVAIGGEWTGVYPTESPGGWNLVGATGVRLFDPDADPPAVLLAGDEVRFVPL